MPWILLAVLTGIVVVGWALVEAHRVRLTRYVLGYPGLPPALEGFTVVQVSDLHASRIGWRERQVVAYLADSRPDLFCVTGDLISSERGVDVAVRVIGKAHGRRGSYFVHGNNEVEELPDRGRLERRLEELGIEVLVNAHRQLEVDGTPVLVVGVDDPKNERDDLDRALEGSGPAAFRILLSHTPETFDEARRRGIELVLAGHTHGGQFCLPWFGALWTDTPRIGLKYSAGLYGEPGCHLVVSRGIGWSLLPVRFLSPPEVVEIRLRSAIRGGP